MLAEVNLVYNKILECQCFLALTIDKYCFKQEKMNGSNYSARTGQKVLK
jgi:hypothetical protein